MMEDIEKHTGEPFVITPCTLNNNLPKLRLIKCCEVLIDFRTCLFPEPSHCSDIKVFSRVEAKIDKVCGCKVIIGGILHKTIKFKSKGCDCKSHEHVKHKSIPFSCFIDFDCTSPDSLFEISGHEIICEFSELKKIKKDCSIKTIFIEKDIIAISVRSN